MVNPLVDMISWILKNWCSFGIANPLSSNETYLGIHNKWFGDLVDDGLMTGSWCLTIGYKYLQFDYSQIPQAKWLMRYLKYHFGNVKLWMAGWALIDCQLDTPLISASISFYLIVIWDRTNLMILHFIISRCLLLISLDSNEGPCSQIWLAPSFTGLQACLSQEIRDNHCTL